MLQIGAKSLELKCMDDDHVYVTRSGRKSKSIVPNYRSVNLSRKPRVRKMPMVPKDSRDQNEGSLQARMEEERAELDRQRREIERLRRELDERQRAQQQQQIPQSQGQRTASNEELSAIISNVQNFHIDIKAPKFKDEIEKNPVEFLEEMEKFFKIKNVKNDRRIILIEQALEGRASLWLETKLDITTYEEFKTSFLEEFYSIPIRVQFKNSWNGKRYNQSQETLQTFYYRQKKDARFFIPQITEYEVNYNIIQQYPLWVRENMSTINFSDSTLIGQTLANLDAINRERVRIRENKSTSNNDNARVSLKQINMRESDVRSKYHGRPRERVRNNTRNNCHRCEQGYSTQDRRNENNTHPFQLPDT